MTYIVIGVVAAALLALFSLFSSAIKDRRKITLSINDEENEAENFPNEKELSFKASVVRCECYTHTVGSKTVKAVKEFFIYFEDEKKRILKYSVPEECYDGFEEGQHGILTTHGDELYSFVLVEGEEK